MSFSGACWDICPFILEMFSGWQKTDFVTVYVTLKVQVRFQNHLAAEHETEEEFLCRCITFSSMRKAQWRPPPIIGRNKNKQCEKMSVFLQTQTIFKSNKVAINQQSVLQSKQSPRKVLSSLCCMWIVEDEVEAAILIRSSILVEHRNTYCKDITPGTTETRMFGFSSPRKVRLLGKRVIKVKWGLREIPLFSTAGTTEGKILLSPDNIIPHSAGRQSTR